MPNKRDFYKENPTDKVLWLDDDTTTIGFTFDRKKIFYLPRDYWEMTPKQKEIFDRENPFWKEFCGG